MSENFACVGVSPVGGGCLAGSVTVGREAFRGGPGTLGVVGEPHRTEHHAVLGVLVPVQLPLRDAEQTRCGDEVTVARERDVHHVAGPILRKRAAGTFVSGHTGEQALFDACEAFCALEGSRELLEARSGELARTVVEDVDPCGIHAFDKLRDLLVRRDLCDLRRSVGVVVSLHHPVLHGPVEGADDEDDEEQGERHEAQKRFQIQHLLLSGRRFSASAFLFPFCALWRNLASSMSF